MTRVYRDAWLSAIFEHFDVDKDGAPGISIAFSADNYTILQSDKSLENYLPEKVLKYLQAGVVILFKQRNA